VPGDRDVASEENGFPRAKVYDARRAQECRVSVESTRIRDAIIIADRKKRWACVEQRLVAHRGGIYKQS
jgi:hypothetical protein